MGTYNSVYVGIYILLPHETVPVTETFRVKPNGKKANTRFDPETGKEYPETTKTRMEVQKPNVYIYDDNYPDLQEDMFWEPAYTGAPKGYTLGLPNGGGFCRDDEFTKSMENIEFQRKILEFKRKYSKYLDYYTKTYGRYEIHYGVVHYAH